MKHSVVFSNKAYNAIIDEVQRKQPVETGGILLGQQVIFEDKIVWVVIESIPPGYSSTHKEAYFEYDETFVNYLANSVSTKYKQKLNLLGLWHRHPGSMDFFSGTDDGTNEKFANLNPYGAISGLVNVDPKLRLTMYHVKFPHEYQRIEHEVGDDLIPEEYFELKYFPESKRQSSQSDAPMPIAETPTSNQLSQSENSISKKELIDIVSETTKVVDKRMAQMEANNADLLKVNKSNRITTVLLLMGFLLMAGLMFFFHFGNSENAVDTKPADALATPQGDINPTTAPSVVEEEHTEEAKPEVLWGVQVASIESEVVDSVTYKQLQATYKGAGISCYKKEDTKIVYIINECPDSNACILFATKLKTGKISPYAVKLDDNYKLYDDKL